MRRPGRVNRAVGFLRLWSAFSSLALNLGLAVTAELAGVSPAEKREAG